MSSLISLNAIFVSNIGHNYFASDDRKDAFQPQGRMDRDQPTVTQAEATAARVRGAGARGKKTQNFWIPPNHLAVGDAKE